MTYFNLEILWLVRKMYRTGLVDLNRQEVMHLNYSAQEEAQGDTTLLLVLVSAVVVTEKIFRKIGKPRCCESYSSFTLNQIDRA